MKGNRKIKVHTVLSTYLRDRAALRPLTVTLIVVEVPDTTIPFDAKSM